MQFVMVSVRGVIVTVNIRGVVVMGCAHDIKIMGSVYRVLVIGSVCGAMVTVIRYGHGNLVQILDSVVCICPRANTLGKGLNPTILHPPTNK